MTPSPPAGQQLCFADVNLQPFANRLSILESLFYFGPATVWLLVFIPLNCSVLGSLAEVACRDRFGRRFE
jgi:hypothetical protein